jgi:hypothetical protein
MANSIEFTDAEGVAASVFGDDEISIHVFDLILSPVLSEYEEASEFTILQGKDHFLAEISRRPAWVFCFCDPEYPDDEVVERRQARFQVFAKGLEEIKRRIQEGPEWVRIPG